MKQTSALHSATCWRAKVIFHVRLVRQLPWCCLIGWWARRSCCKVAKVATSCTWRCPFGFVKAVYYCCVRGYRKQATQAVQFCTDTPHQWMHIQHLDHSLINRTGERTICATGSQVRPPAQPVQCGQKDTHNTTGWTQLVLQKTNSIMFVLGLLWTHRCGRLRSGV